MSAGPDQSDGISRILRVAHLTTVDMSLRFLLRPQLLAVVETGGEAIGISAPGRWADELEQDGVRHIALPDSTRGFSPVRDLRAMWQLWRTLKRESITVLHTHNPKPGVYGRMIGRLAGVPLVVNTMHGLYATETDSLPKRLVVYGLEGVAARFSDIELLQNPEDLELCQRRRILPRGKGRPLGNGVDLARFDPRSVDQTARKRLRAEWGVDDSQIVVGSVGRLVEEKGYLELFEMTGSLSPAFAVVVVGPDDPEKSDALPRDVIEEARLRGVRFLGMRTDVAEIYSAMDLFVLASHREGFPRAAMEAAAMGLPIVATDIRGCRQVVEHGVNGLLVPVRNTSHLQSAVERIGSDPEMRIRMGSASRSKAVAEFDERQVVRIVMDSYRDGLRAKGLGHLLPPTDTQWIRGQIRRAVPEDAAGVAGLHYTEMGSGFLPALGLRFMELLYRAMIGFSGSIVLVADGEAGPSAFVAGVTDVGAFYRYFVRRFGLRSLAAIGPRLLSPRILRKAWESFRYGRDQTATPAELLSLVVAPVARGRGLSLRLGAALLEDLATRGVDSVKVVVGGDNRVAIAAYEKMGFRSSARIEVHSGDTSEVLVWSA